MCEYGSLNLRLWFLRVILSFLLIRHSKIQCRIPVAKFCRCTAWHFQIKIFVLLLLTWHQAIFYATSTLFSVLNFSKGKPKWKNFFFSFFFSHSFAKEANFYFKCHPTQITRKAITDLLSHSEYSPFCYKSGWDFGVLNKDFVHQWNCLKSILRM